MVGVDSNSFIILISHQCGLFFLSVWVQKFASRVGSKATNVKKIRVVWDKLFQDLKKKSLEKKPLSYRVWIAVSVQQLVIAKMHTVTSVFNILGLPSPSTLL